MEGFSGRHLQKESSLRDNLQVDIWGVWVWQERERDNLAFR